MRLSEFSYKLPGELIAQQPVSPRDHSRLLVLDRASGRLEHKHFFDLPEFLQRGDLLVLNDTKVFPARLIGKKEKSGGKIEVFLLKEIKRGIWQCLVGGKNRQVEQKIIISEKLYGRVISREHDGTWLVSFNLSGKKFLAEINLVGKMPLPPYIKRDKPSQTDVRRYQTVYADNKRSGSVAAPTAGLHFTPHLLKKIEAKGVEPVYLTLHVGLGTFLPVKTENIKEHKMHAEWYEIEKAALAKIVKAKKEGRKIIAVGTTSARVLETIINKNSLRVMRYARLDSLNTSQARRALRDLSGWTDIFIYPGYKFKAVDALVTNFHLPESTLLMLVSAFAGQAMKKKSTGLELIKKAYREAIKKNYHFFSYGDAMLIK